MMSLEFLNPLMLFGLAALSLPVIAHLLTKKRFDVVEWGAMQFLDLGKQRRRRIRLEELLLLLLRMAIVAAVVFAMARPTIVGGPLTAAGTGGNRDIVFVLDGSYSMGRTDAVTSPDQRARSTIRNRLAAAAPGDTFTLIDARDVIAQHPRRPGRNVAELTTALDALPSPAGSSNLAAALASALEILSTTSHARREIIILTDGQAWGWHADDNASWARIDELRRQPAVEPGIWVVDVEADADPPRNFSLGQVTASRETAPVGFPLRLSTVLTYRAASGPGECDVYFEVDGQRLAESTLHTPLLEPGGEFTAEFEYRLPAPGSHVLSIVLDEDALPGDNRCDVAVTAIEPLAVLIVDGAPHLDPSRSETFFAAAALRAGEGEPVLIDSEVVASDRLNERKLQGWDVVVLANVATLSEEHAALLRQFVAAGGGLLVAPGDRVSADQYATLLGDMLPGRLAEYIDTDAGAAIETADLKLPWPWPAADVEELATARFGHYWRIEPREDAEVFMPLDAGAPAIAAGWHGQGRVMLLSFPLDADDSTLPTKAVYVSLLHEFLFYLAGSQAVSHNVAVGEPLVQPVAEDVADADYRWMAPDGTSTAANAAGQFPSVQLDAATQPGVYRLERVPPGGGETASARVAYFTAEFDRSEADLTPLTDADIAQLSAGGRMTFVASPEELAERLAATTARTEVWQLLLIVAAGLLCLEIWLTRRLVQGGHAVLDAETPQPTPLQRG